MMNSSTSGKSTGTERLLRRLGASWSSRAACNSPRELLRKKRNQAIYDVAGLISEKEAKAILKHAVKFVDEIKRQIEC